jgi:hypothetical protein
VIVEERLEEAQAYLDAAQRAVAELVRSPLLRVEGATKGLLDPELLADVISENLCALDCMLSDAQRLSALEESAEIAQIVLQKDLANLAEAQCAKEYEELETECRRLREALAPFANRAAERAMQGETGRKHSALTESQWRRALEAYQECPGGDMCGCKPR